MLSAKTKCQIDYLIGNIESNESMISSFLIILINSIIALVLFALAYRNLRKVFLLQFLLLSFITAILVFLFTSTYMIRLLSLTTRLILMPVSIILCLGIAIYFFGWFPTGEPLPWILFVVCFLICFGVSVAITLHNNKKEDNVLNKALEEMK